MSTFTPIKQETLTFDWENLESDSPVSHSFDFLAFVHIPFYVYDTKSYVNAYGDEITT